jgi:hypothetical protein
MFREAVSCKGRNTDLLTRAHAQRRLENVLLVVSPSFLQANLCEVIKSTQ